MRFKLDENFATEVAKFLRSCGHDATTVVEERLGGADDSVVARIVCEENRALITLDRDFADIRGYPPAAYPGLIVFRVTRQEPDYLLELCARLLPHLSKDGVAGELWGVEDAGIRRRVG